MDIRNKLEFMLFQLLVGPLSWGSPRAVHDLMENLGRVLGSVIRYRRTLVLDQLEQAFPQLEIAEREKLADEVYRHLGRTVGEVFGSRFGDLAAQVKIDPGWDPLDEALSRGKGAIVVTGHIGNFELGGAVLARRYALLDVIKPQRNDLFDDYINELRLERGIATVTMDRSGPAVARHLRQGGLVSLLIDQDAGQQGVFVPFLGQMASTWPGAARLSLRTGCPIVPLAILRQDDSSHCMFIGDALWPEGRPSTPEGTAEYLQEITACLEGYVHRNPEQWFWVHRRWKSQMPEQASQFDPKITSAREGK